MIEELRQQTLAWLKTEGLAQSGLDQQAEALGLSYHTFRKFLRGETDLDRENLLHLIGVIGGDAARALPGYDPVPDALARLEREAGRALVLREDANGYGAPKRTLADALRAYAKHAGETPAPIPMRGTIYAATATVTLEHAGESVDGLDPILARAREIVELSGSPCLYELGAHRRGEHRAWMLGVEAPPIKQVPNKALVVFEDRRAGGVVRVATIYHTSRNVVMAFGLGGEMRELEEYAAREISLKAVLVSEVRFLLEKTPETPQLGDVG